LGPLTAHRFFHSGRDIGAGVLDAAAERSGFTSSRHCFAVEAGLEEHTDLDAVPGAVQRRKRNQSSDGGKEESNDNADFQIRPR